MQNWQRFLALTGFGISLMALAVVLSGVALTDLVVDYWWHEELGYGGFFWWKTLYRYLLSGTVTGLFFLIFFLNFRAASRYLGVDEDAIVAGEEAGTTENPYRGWIRWFQQGSSRFYIPLSLVLAILIAWPFHQQWDAALLFMFAPDSGVTDPVFNQDVSFYLFAYPVFELIQFELLAAFTILTLAITALYWLEHRHPQVSNKAWPRGAKLHTYGLILVSTLLVCWGFILDRVKLLYTDAHEPQFFGPGFIELGYQLPLIWLSALSLLAAVVATLRFIHTREGSRAVGFLISLFLVTLGLRYLNAVPYLLDRFVVKPNPVQAERRGMKNNIDATLTAYGLNDVKTIDMTPNPTGSDIFHPQVAEHLYNVPVWDPEFLDEVYQQLQGIRPYYRFPNVDIARYTLKGHLEQVNLSAREVNIKGLPEAAKNWENTHLRYTHGYGVVMTPTAQDGETPMKWYLRDLNLDSGIQIGTEKPDIYFGEENLPYAVVPNKLNIVGISSFDEESSFNYTGKGGIRLDSLFRRLLLSLHLREERLFLSTNISTDSRVMLRRNIVERVRQLTPFLHLDHDPYLVVTPKRLYWMMDAYTLSDGYPAARKTTLRFNGENQPTRFNYIRNSVKIVVDAFDGSVDYYVVNPDDPVIRGYAKAFPGFFRDINVMPPALREQIRYPRDLFSAQMAIYARYHQADPALFYEQAETWDFPKINDQPMRPFYLTTYLLEGIQEPESFVMVSPMTPTGRANLSGLAVAGTPKIVQGNYKTEIVMYRFSRDTQVEGPAQVSALIDQDPVIAQQFALWDQKGSHVLRGRIIVLPIGHSVLYLQPVYISSTGNTRIPELQRIILAMNNVVVMDASLEQGIRRLQQLLTRTGDTRSIPAATSASQGRDKLPEMGKTP